MKVCLIGENEKAFFHSLLLPKVVAEIETESPVLALGLVDEDGVACGAAAGWVAEDIFEIHSLYVAPAFRRKGGGRLLMEILCNLAKGFCEEITVSFVVTDEKEHETLLPFLQGTGFHSGNVIDRLYGITLGELGKSPFFAGAKSGQTAHAVPFDETPHGSLMRIYKAAMVNDENYLLQGLTDPSVDGEVSMAMLDGSEIRSFVAVVSQGTGVLSLAWAYGGHSADLPVLFRTAFVRAKEKYPAQTLLTVQAVHPAAEKLVRTLIPNAKQLAYTFVRFLTE